MTAFSLDELLPSGPDDKDWSDVVHRATRARRRRRASALLAVVATFGLLIAAAYALGYPIVDFKSAPKGPRAVVNDFGSLEVGAPAGMSPGVLPREARRITSVVIDGKPRVLWVAPTHRGGYCEQWAGVVSCRVDPHVVKRVLVSALYSARRGEPRRAVIGGSFLQRKTARLELAYQDGTAAEIPFVWVTEPIDAGFYLFKVPRAHWAKAHGPKAVRLYDDRGRLIASERAPNPTADPAPLNLHRLAGYPPLSVPVGAIWSKRRQLFDLHADDGAHIGLWVAPSSRGGTCFWTNQTNFCRPRGREKHPRALALGFSGATTHVTLCCNVGPNVAHVVARFRDGDRVELTPREGYLVWPIPSRHYPPGHRLEELIAIDAVGRQVGLQRVSPMPGLYPCKRPKKLGYGVSMCP